MATDRFENVQVIKKANVYYDGKVTSRTVLFPDGTRKTLGVMLAGTYDFGTEAPEVMEVLGGEMKVKLPGSTGWRTCREGESFSVPGDSRFQLVIDAVADYCCSYG
ncbi:MAG TPA: pyrimidine/purine nucleoside phosphorylase [Polyangia bacterium]|nr:pyrimidine/purine nucleoside phosphorylase [Polyangia bacterium]